ncbi:MAG: hypothetical protein GC129_07310 [Proteobacteria bacterium]|nr:hypothetical protein [Pseudomonadota bacterium]
MIDPDKIPATPPHIMAHDSAFCAASGQRYVLSPERLNELKAQMAAAFGLSTPPTFHPGEPLLNNSAKLEGHLGGIRFVVPLEVRNHVWHLSRSHAEAHMDEAPRLLN